MYKIGVELIAISYKSKLKLVISIKLFLFFFSFSFGYSHSKYTRESSSCDQDCYMHWTHESWPLSKSHALSKCQSSLLDKILKFKIHQGCLNDYVFSQLFLSIHKETKPIKRNNRGILIQVGLVVSKQVRHIKLDIDLYNFC